MKRKNFLQIMTAGTLGSGGLSFLNEGFLVGNHNTSLRKSSGKARERELLDFDWKFRKGEHKNAEKITFDDHNWRMLDLPHDWSIESNYDEDNPASWHSGYLPGGIGWYRKSLRWKPDWEGKKIYIDFNGVYMNSDVWINGHHLGNRPYGYISFRYDLTPYLKEGTNTIAVRVDNSKQPSCRWYSGSGIYRHVWLNVLNPVHVAHWGTNVVVSEIKNKEAKVVVHTDLKNTDRIQKTITVQQRVSTASGEIIAGSEQELGITGSDEKLTQELVIRNPEKWSPDNPYLYSVETLVSTDNGIIDSYHTPLGIRSLEFSSDSGFKINGKKTLLKGVCNHHDAGPVGAAVPDDVLYWRLKKLKQMGCNALRTAHNPQSPEFYAFCDQLGMMVMDEAFDGWDTPKAKYDYGRYFDEWWQQDLGDFIRRDRNHPSIIMWSIGNEVRNFTEKRQKELVDLIKNMDNSRPVTQGAGYHGKYIDVAGFNGHGEMKGVLQHYHKTNPAKPLIGTEMTHTNQTRSVYRSQTWYRARDYRAPWENKGKWNRIKDKVYKVPDLCEHEVFKHIPEKYLSSYDNAFVRINVRDQFRRDRDFPFLLGSFRWSGYDYIGEALNRWPTRASNFGIIDLAGIPKDHYYLYQSLWSATPMVHLLPHWTHPGKEETNIPVVAYTNGHSVELFLNDKSLGEKTMTDDLQIVWQVPYQPGNLHAIAKDREGHMVADTTRKTAGDPYQILLQSNRTAMQANRKDVVRLEVHITDKNGVLVPHSDHRVQFSVEGPGRLIGVENGDIADLDSCKGKSRKAFYGKCMGLIQAGKEEGLLRISASSDDLQSDQLRIPIV